MLRWHVLLTLPSPVPAKTYVIGDVTAACATSLETGTCSLTTRVARDNASKRNPLSPFISHYTLSRPISPTAWTVPPTWPETELRHHVQWRSEVAINQQSSRHFGSRRTRFGAKSWTIIKTITKMLSERNSHFHMSKWLLPFNEFVPCS